MVFSQMLKKLRGDMGLTQADLASELELSRAAIAGYENSGKEPNFEVLVKIANYFGVTTDYMLGLKQKSAAAQKADFIKTINRALGDAIYAPVEVKEHPPKDFGALLYKAFSDAQKVDVEDEIAQLLVTCALTVRDLAGDVKASVMWEPEDFADYDLEGDSYYMRNSVFSQSATFVQYSLDTINQIRANRFRAYSQRSLADLNEALDGFSKDIYDRIKTNKLPKRKGR